MMATVLLLAASLASAACLEVEGARITGSELRSLGPEWEKVPSDAVLGYAPVPGARRTLSGVELKRIAERHGVAVDPPASVCFERPMERLSATRVLEAVRETLGIRDVRIEIVESSNYPVPRGELVFPRSGLTPPASPGRGQPAFWKGYVLYGGGNRFTVWVRARITVVENRLVAASDLRAGVPIDAANTRAEAFEGFPQAQQVAHGFEEVAGRVPRQTIRAGSPIWAASLEDAPDVQRGQTVRVEVRSGRARLMFEGRAESSGRRGDSIPVRNPESGKRFQAQVKGNGSVAVEVTAGNSPSIGRGQEDGKEGGPQ